jgi:hypothetical protein|tara:strand:+ start:326 stop:493 length:168 start_codon:yes stop_codon:yes gene_type:complete
VKIKLTRGDFMGRVVEAKEVVWQGIPSWAFAVEEFGKFVVPANWAVALDDKNDHS